MSITICPIWLWFIRYEYDYYYIYSSCYDKSTNWQLKLRFQTGILRLDNSSDDEASVQNEFSKSVSLNSLVGNVVNASNCHLIKLYWFTSNYLAGNQMPEYRSTGGLQLSRLSLIERNIDCIKNSIEWQIAIRHGRDEYPIIYPASKISFHTPLWSFSMNETVAYEMLQFISNSIWLVFCFLITIEKYSQLPDLAWLRYRRLIIKVRRFFVAIIV